MKKFTLLLIFLTAYLNAADFSAAVNKPPVHEAFISKFADVAPQEVLTRKPPEPKAETPPPKPNDQAVWIAGYWHWLRDKQDYVWICGVWRLPPPDHFWLSGFWKEEKGGWTWISGAWLENKFKDTSKLIYTQNPPPASQNESVGTPPSGDYFWSMGYWQFSQTTKGYQWFSGSWQKFNPKWIFEPGHWIWRPEGYLFVSAYWDWPIETRGQTYDCYTLHPLPASGVVQQLTPCYPDYIPVCNWCRHYCPEVWVGCDCLPPWWGWDDWWSLPSGDGWWLWWWWLHDGYPYPPFVIDIFDLIPPPTIIIIDLWGGIFPPIFITPVGVPTLDQWLDAIADILGGTLPGPVLPPDAIDKIIDAVQKLIPPTGKDRPQGKENGEHINKPGSHNDTPATGPAVVPQAPADPVPPQAHVPEVPQVTAPIPVPPPVVRIPPPAYQPPVYQPPVYQPPVIRQPPVRYPPIWNDGHRPNRPRPPTNIDINWGGGKGHGGGGRPGKGDGGHQGGGNRPGKGKGDGGQQKPQRHVNIYK